MNEKNLVRSLIAVAGICFLAVFILLVSGGASEVAATTPEEMIQKLNQTDTENSSNSGGTTGQAGAVNSQTENANAPSLSEQEIKSVDDLTKILSFAVRKDISTKSFLELIKTTGLVPVATTNKNPDTGSMTTVRTSNTLPGTRYFHAQFFGEDTLKDFPQHISFEIRPSTSSMAVAIKMIEQNFKGDLKREESREGYNRWSTGECQIIWSKKLTLEDIEDSPINPREKSDVGTVWVAVEHDIHCGEKHED